MLGVQHDDRVALLVQLVQNPVRAATRGPLADEVAAEGFANPAWFTQQVARDEFDHCCGDRLGQLVGERPLRRRGDAQFPGIVLGRTAP